MDIRLIDSTLVEISAYNECIFGNDNIAQLTNRLYKCGIKTQNIGVLANRKSKPGMVLVNSNSSLRSLISNINKDIKILLTLRIEDGMSIEQLSRIKLYEFNVTVKLVGYLSQIEKIRKYIDFFVVDNIDVFLMIKSDRDHVKDTFSTISELIQAKHVKGVYINNLWLCDKTNAWFDDFKNKHKFLKIIFYNIDDAFFRKDICSDEIYIDTALVVNGFPEIYSTIDVEKTVNNEAYPLEKIRDLFINQELIYANGTNDNIYYSFFKTNCKLHDLEIREVMAAIPKEAFFTTKNAMKYLRLVRREKWKGNLCIIVPTCNRKKAIEYYINVTGKRLWHYGIDLIIYDSSDNDEIYRLVEKARKQGYTNIVYDKYDGYYDGKSIDHKLIEAYRQYESKYKYIWLCRDGIAINFDYMHLYLLDLIEEEQDLILVDSDWRDIKNTGNKTYDECTKLFHEQCIRMVTLGTIIVKSSFMMKVINEIPISEENYSLWQVIAIFQYYAKHPESVRASSYMGNVFIYNPSGTISSFWNTNGKALWQWAERWYVVIASLPEVYNRYKKDVYHIEMVDFHPFSVKTLMLIKANNGLGLSKIINYWKYLKWVSDRPLWQYCFLSMLPIPHGMLRNVLMKNESIYHKIIRDVYRNVRDYIKGR